MKFVAINEPQIELFKPDPNIKTWLENHRQDDDTKSRTVSKAVSRDTRASANPEKMHRGRDILISAKSCIHLPFLYSIGANTYSPLCVLNRRMKHMNMARSAPSPQQVFEFFIGGERPHLPPSLDPRLHESHMEHSLTLK